MQISKTSYQDIPSVSYSNVQSIILSPLHLFPQAITTVDTSKVSKGVTRLSHPLGLAQKLCEQSDLTKPLSIIPGTTQYYRG